MNVVFYHIGEPIPYADYCIKSIRRFIPNSRIIHLTDMKTPEIKGVDITRRSQPKHRTPHYLGYQYLSEMEENEVLFVDTDMMIAGNMSDALNLDVDVVAATRCSRDRVRPSYAKKYPYCSMMVVKNKQFWTDCYDYLVRWSEDSARSPLNNMDAVRRVIDSGKYTTKILDGNTYNVLPKRFYENAIVYHFKVKRKNLMKKFWEKYYGTENPQ